MTRCEQQICNAIDDTIEVVKKVAYSPVIGAVGRLFGGNLSSKITYKKGDIVTNDKKAYVALVNDVSGADISNTRYFREHKTSYLLTTQPTFSTFGVIREDQNKSIFRVNTMDTIIFVDNVETESFINRVSLDRLSDHFLIKVYVYAADGSITLDTNEDITVNVRKLT